MKKKVQNYVRTCRKCQLKELTIIKMEQPIVLIDIPRKTFDTNIDIVSVIKFSCLL